MILLHCIVKVAQSVVSELDFVYKAEGIKGSEIQAKIYPAEIVYDCFNEYCFILCFIGLSRIKVYGLFLKYRNLIDILKKVIINLR